MPQPEVGGTEAKEEVEARSTEAEWIPIVSTPQLSNVDTKMGSADGWVPLVKPESPISPSRLIPNRSGVGEWRRVCSLV